MDNPSRDSLKDYSARAIPVADLPEVEESQLHAAEETCAIAQARRCKRGDRILRGYKGLALRERFSVGVVGGDTGILRIILIAILAVLIDTT